MPDEKSDSAYLKLSTRVEDLVSKLKRGAKLEIKETLLLDLLLERHPIEFYQHALRLGFDLLSSEGKAAIIENLKPEEPEQFFDEIRIKIKGLTLYCAYCGYELRLPPTGKIPTPKDCPTVCPNCRRETIWCENPDDPTDFWGKMKAKEKPIEIKLSQLTASLIGKRVSFKCQIVGHKIGKAMEEKLVVKCKKCGEKLSEIDLKDSKNASLTYKLITSRKLEMNDVPCTWDDDCTSRSGEHKPIVQLGGGEMIDYSILYVREPPESIEATAENEYQRLATKRWTVIYLGVPPDVNNVRITGCVMKNPLTDNIEIFAGPSGVKPLEQEFKRLKVTKDDHQMFKKYFSYRNLDAIAENQIAPHIKGRSFEKLSALLVIHSPYRIFDIYNSRLIRGCLRGIWIGDTKTGKTESLKDLCYAHYRLGELVFVEMSSRTGLLYTIDTDLKTIIWGALPMNDRGFVALDGFQRYPREQIGEMREALEQERVQVRRCLSDERMARVRCIATLNPPHSSGMEAYTYKVLALRSTEQFCDPADLTRWDFVIPFSADDVEPKEIATAKPMERPIPDDIFKKHVLWVWSLEPENIRYSENAKAKIVHYTEELLPLSATPYPLVHRGVRDVLTRIAVAYACLTHSVSDGGEYVEVKEEHVDSAYNFLMTCIERMEYDLYVNAVREEKDFNESEILSIVAELEERHLKILKALEFGRRKSPDLAAQFSISTRTIKRDYEVLRKYKLIKTSPKGVQLTERGVQFVKFLRNIIRGSGDTVTKNVPVEQLTVTKNVTVSPQEHILYNKILEHFVLSAIPEEPETVSKEEICERLNVDAEKVDGMLEKLCWERKIVATDPEGMYFSKPKGGVR